MKQAVLLYNPKAGNRQIVNSLDYITERLQGMGYELKLYRSDAKGAITQYIIDQIDPDKVDLILISGGDGTINECINGLATKDKTIPVAILPLGTANDFAHTALIPEDVKQALDLIENGKLQFIDVGKVNDKYFINVCNMGLFSGVSHVIDLELKKKFGKLAYYVKGFEELQNYQAMDLEINTSEKSITGKYVLVLIFNGKGAGGFMKLAKHASITDGVFDMVCIKEVEIYEIPRLFLKVLQGEHLEEPNVDYMTGSWMSVKCNNQNKQFITDIDGEEGPDFPLEISVVSDLFQVYLAE
ncbi:MAG: diacylglycerol kinase family protein [Cellulosilyticaceae bacterium]